ncbi:flocculation protein FLO11-like isoform X1 [Anopheles albimanus]|uniref:flocculation protein FLO11-like isoform X1 n=1 Tax=Anopheles albimanus TaxID=7167 RepID=UPI00163EB758|nr:flocculation protein FLO11-like isoform X1 [Anopheles albimanus]
MSSQIPPLVCHTPPPIDFDLEDDEEAEEEEEEDDYALDIPDDDDFGDFATVPVAMVHPLPTEVVIEESREREEKSAPSANSNAATPTAETTTHAEQTRNNDDEDSIPSLVLSPNRTPYNEQDAEAIDADVEDIDFQPFRCSTQQPEPPPEDCISLPSLHLDTELSKSEDDDNIPVPLQLSASGSAIDTEIDLPAEAAAAAAAERTTPVILEGAGRFDDNTENDFTDFTTASNERSSVVLEIPTANDVSFELDDFAQLESTPSADSNFVSQQSRGDFATFDADFSKFDSFQASFPATGDGGESSGLPKTAPTVDEGGKHLSTGDLASVSGRKPPIDPLPDDDFDDFQEFAAFEGGNLATETLSTAGSSSNNREQPAQAMRSAIQTQDSATLQQDTPGFEENDAEDDDEFGEFSDFKQSTTVSNNTPVTSVPAFSMERVHALLATMFPTTASDAASTTDTGQQSWTSIPDNLLHSQLQDFDNTNAVSYQHSKSSSSKALVTALGIDSRNIMYGPKWNSSMPRFAANLSFNPLEPLKPSAALPKEANSNEKYGGGVTNAKHTASTSYGAEPLQPNVAGSSVPAAQFDWNSSGLVNPLEASHAHTLLLDLEQLEVMASLKDKINVDSSSSYPPAHRFASSNIAPTVQPRSPTTCATTATLTVPTTSTATTTTTSPLLLLPQLSSSPLPPQPQPPQKMLSSSVAQPALLSTTTTKMNTYNHLNNNKNEPPPPSNINHLLDDSTPTPLLRCFIGGDNDDLLIATTPPTSPATTTMLPSMHTTNNTITTTTPPPPSVVAMAVDTMGSMCSLRGPGARTTTALLAYDAGGDHRPPVSCSDRRQSFDDYLDLSVQEMLQKAIPGQPPDGTKGEILDSKIAEDAGPLAADDIAVTNPSGTGYNSSSPLPAAMLALPLDGDDEDVRSLDFANIPGSSSAQYSSPSLSQAVLDHLPQQQQQQQQQPMSIPISTFHGSSNSSSSSISNSNSCPTSSSSVPVMRTIKLPETHIFTPSRGGTPVSRDITDRDIVVREYHDVEYSLESKGNSRKEAEPDEFNDFQSAVEVGHTPIVPTASGYSRPVIGRSPTEEMEHQRHEHATNRQPSIDSANGPAVDKRDDAFDEDDEFTDFQAAPTIPATILPPTVQPINKSVSSVQANRSATSSPVMLLSPAILLPQQTGTNEGTRETQGQNVAQINWPEPGVDPDELARFEAAFAKPAAGSVQSNPNPAGTGIGASVSNQKPQPTTTVSKVKYGQEEDEWTDFMSSKPVVAHSMPTTMAAAAPPPPGPAAVHSSSTPVASSAAQEEWTDFISSTPSAGTGSTSQAARLSSSHNNFNYSRPSVAKPLNSWSQPQLPPPQFNSWNSNSLYYNPMSSLSMQSPQHPRPSPTAATPNSLYAAGPPVNLPYQQQTVASVPGGYPQLASVRYGNPPQQQMAPGVNLLPELSFITPHSSSGVGARMGGSGGPPSQHTKPAAAAAHSFLSNVISSNSFAKK